jgi:hypothetical protein
MQNTQADAVEFLRRVRRKMVNRDWHFDMMEAVNIDVAKELAKGRDLEQDSVADEIYPHSAAIQHDAVVALFETFAERIDGCVNGHLKHDIGSFEKQKEYLSFVFGFWTREQELQLMDETIERLEKVVPLVR